MKLFYQILLTLLLSVNCQETGKILQITDIHYDPYYQVGSPANCFHIYGFEGMGCCHSNNIPTNPKRNAGKYGDYNCDTPYQLINETFDWIKKSHPDIDYVFYTGDTASHQHFSQSYQKNLDVIKEVSGLLDYYFKEIPIYNILGNHDTWPIDQFPNYPHNQDWLNSILPHWNKLFTHRSNKTFSYGGYYSQLLNKNLRLVAINSLYFDSYNFLAHNYYYDYVEQLNWLENIFELSEKNNQKIWFIGHIYPMGSESKELFTIKFNDLFKKYHKIILFQIWGHLHNDMFILYSDYDKLLSDVIGVGFVAPSLMPDKHNPSYRIYEYNKETFDIINYYQYSASLSLANIINKLEYTLDYNAIDAYNLDDLSAESWNLLYTKMRTNEDLFNFFYSNYNVGEKVSCNQICKNKMLCSIRYNNVTSYQNCLS